MNKFLRGVILGAAVLALGSWYFYQNTQKISQACPLATALDVTASDAIKESNLQHLACICDGNRRWAKKLGRAPTVHQESMDAIRTTIQFCIEKKIRYLSLYLLSAENVSSRSPSELNHLLELFEQEAKKGVDEFTNNGIQVRFIGDRSLFPEIAKPYISHIEEQTGKGTKLQVNLLFCYGARQEIAAAVQEIARECKSGTLSLEKICPDTIRSHLWLSDIPDPDLIIRTSGCERLSNFLLYQAAYSEIYFVDYYWPEMSADKLQTLYERFTNSERRFGG